VGIRQRTWVSGGKEKSAWVVEYFDAERKWRLKTFKTKKDAQDFEATTRVNLKRGKHVADSASITVGEAGDLWIETGEENELVPSSLKQCREHLRLHIKPFIGDVKLSRLTVPAVRAYEQQLRADGRSPAMTRKVIASLGSIIADAQERGLAMHNPVREMRTTRGKRRTKATRERKKKLVVGEDIPTPAEIRAILNTASRPGSNMHPGFRRAFFSTAALAGLRASELRGLRWEDIDLGKAALTVRQRADAWGGIDQPKSEAGNRTVPLPAMVVNALREWKLACPMRDTGKKDNTGQPIRELHYVFPNGNGNVENTTNLVRRHWHPLQIAAGVSKPVFDDTGNQVVETDEDGKLLLDDSGKPIPVMVAKYSGLHALRHFFCSWCAARPQDGGLGLPLKTVQERMGHSTLAMTADTYGHLFPSQDDAEVLAAGERALMAM
jgi:integrase